MPAFPTIVLDAGTFAFMLGQGFSGPFKLGTDVWCFPQDNFQGVTHACLSVDNGVTWNEIDSGNAPSSSGGTGYQGALYCIVVGTVIWCIANTTAVGPADNTLNATAFDTVSQTWGTTIQSTLTFVSGVCTGGTGIDGSVLLCAYRSSDQKIIIVAQAGTQPNANAPIGVCSPRAFFAHFDTVALSFDANWTGVTNASGDANNLLIPTGIVIDATNKSHVICSLLNPDGTPNTLSYFSISSGDAISSNVQLAGSTAANVPIYPVCDSANLYFVYSEDGQNVVFAWSPLSAPSFTFVAMLNITPNIIDGYPLLIFDASQLYMWLVNDDQATTQTLQEYGVTLGGSIGAPTNLATAASFNSSLLNFNSGSRFGLFAIGSGGVGFFVGSSGPPPPGIAASGIIAVGSNSNGGPMPITLPDPSVVCSMNRPKKCKILSCDGLVIQTSKGVMYG